MNYKSCVSLLVVIFIIVDCGIASAIITKDLGTVGETYPVVEPDVVAELKKAATQLSASHNPRHLHDKMKEYQPPNIQTLPKAREDRTFLVTMDYTIDHDIVDGDGNTIYPKGFTFNPLDYLTFPGGLVVIDGTDPNQIKWFQDTPYAENHHARLLLSDGHAFDLIKEFNRPVFYLTDDIAKRLRLAAVPSIIVQKERKLEVHEFKVDQEHDEENDEKY